MVCPYFSRAVYFQFIKPILCALTLEHRIHLRIQISRLSSLGYHYNWFDHIDRHVLLIHTLCVTNSQTTKSAIKTVNCSFNWMKNCSQTSTPFDVVIPETAATKLLSYNNNAEEERCWKLNEWFSLLQVLWFRKITKQFAVHHPNIESSNLLESMHK